MPDLNIINHPLTGTPFGTALDLCLVLAALVWLMTAVTRECSWVDRLWSVTPPVYCLLVAAAADFDSARLNIMAALVTLWGARLTFNFARKGGYWAGGEDYRWPYVRERLSPIQFQLVNIFFISFPQMLLIWLFTSPMHQAWVGLDAPLNWLDAVAAILFLALLLGRNRPPTNRCGPSSRTSNESSMRAEAVEQPFLRTGLYTCHGTRTISARSPCGGSSTCLASQPRVHGCTGPGSVSCC